MKSIGDRLGEAGESKAGWGENLLDWIKGKMIDTYFFYIGG